MAIDTDAKKLSIMEFCNMLEPGLPLSPGSLGQDDQQSLLWGYSGILWGTPTLGGGVHYMNDIILLKRKR